MTDTPTPKLCPKGHKVGTTNGGGRCGAKRCGTETAALMGPAKLDLDALAKVAEHDKPFVQRVQLAAIPQGLTGEAAQDWAKAKLVDMLPEAVASLQWDLRYGAPKVRAEAADKVLRANGLEKREAAPTGGGLIVLNFGSSAEGGTSVPWLERMHKKGE